MRSASGVQRVPDPRLELFIVKRFLAPGQCRQLIDLIDANRRPSTIADDIGVADFRTSETCDLDASEPVVGEVDQAICALLGLPAALGEPIQGQRYAPGQEFKPHTDTFEPLGPDYHVHCADRGNRSWTAMIYLNQPDEGGATRFKTIGKIVQPETGKLLAWNNLLPDGRPNPATLHQGMQVRKGTKYILTKWFRERAAAG
ncbi:MAG TPA: 2OG-Fe(II) oxygenase [Sphingomicrobium sp.]|nr:2OG-Fe(II) oxygenase [Sphingomicrobium sp.]